MFIQECIKFHEKMLGFGVDFGHNKLLCIDFAKAVVREIKFLWRNQPINLLFVMID